MNPLLPHDREPVRTAEPDRLPLHRQVAREVIASTGDPRDVIHAITRSRATLREMRQNLGWAVAHNVVAIDAHPQR